MDYDINVDTGEIQPLMSGWYTEDCMDDPYILHMIKSYSIKYQSHDPDTPNYIDEVTELLGIGINVFYGGRFQF